ncbi:MAG: stress responsive alpha-beta barrel domain-containing protein [Desulfuromonadales bacterium GWD2_61_12]|nr:MAG: stress responsive alpha-beta barrel domain-containing protein [Desulfuromonadales bacterium GWC2_61_20]OGR36306.1 MAG: stress responsive alpha-beta barrel domain-containing protein [Desulfuromonadales bacterium GWD2_61_12]HAD04603.1 stress responsive alpha-beta barrel domain-containing protein [Desulfuromonas sp.]HBT82967.1 stress responsive alpha-beta barrel domain-containing protein [Desulfuromonas sp.]
MLKHVVLFKFKPEAQTGRIEDLAVGLGALPDSIPEIREFVFGHDVLHTERSYDFALVSLFDDQAALQRYQVHPDHQAVVAIVKEICSSVVAADFTC